MPAPRFQNTNTQLIDAMRKHAANKGVVHMDTEDLKRLCALAEAAIKQNPALDTEYIA
jgi:hypothetical protein